MYYYQCVFLAKTSYFSSRHTILLFPSLDSRNSCVYFEKIANKHKDQLADYTKRFFAQTPLLHLLLENVVSGSVGWPVAYFSFSRRSLICVHHARLVILFWHSSSAFAIRCESSAARSRNIRKNETIVVSSCELHFRFTSTTDHFFTLTVTGRDSTLSHCIPQDSRTVRRNCKTFQLQKNVR